MKATVKKITEINRTRMIEDGWTDEYTEGMELLGGEIITIRPMIVNGKISSQWFEGAKDWKPRHIPFFDASANENHFALFNWHISWLKDFRDE